MQKGYKYKYKCKYKYKFRTHLESNRRDKSHKCTKCDHATPNQASLKAHLKYTAEGGQNNAINVTLNPLRKLV